jgi:serine/threonine-protein phosphatase 5
MASPDIEAATALKQEGNKAFAAHDWVTAAKFYTQAIEKYDRDPSFFCNRAQVRDKAITLSIEREIWLRDVAEWKLL